MHTPDRLILEALQRFAAGVTARFKAQAAGQPEDQLRGPIENLLTAVGKALGRKHLVAKGEPRLPDRLGRPDYAVLADKLLAGYIELKEPGKGADPKHYRGHDRQQWKRFQAIPNLIYTDGNEWMRFEHGERAGKLVRLSGDITKSGKTAVRPEDVDALRPLLTDFLSWNPIVPKDARALAQQIAPLCKMLRQEVKDALTAGSRPIVHLADAWRKLLISGADDDRIADAYAQTVTFALLLARSEGAGTIEEDLHNPIKKLAADHALLSRALDVLTDKSVREEISSSLRLLQRVINSVPTRAMKGNGKSDPWLYFYEDFLAAYDPKLRKDAGAYYTPVEVVHAQVRLIDRLLVDKLNRPMGFADQDVITLDPAVGTGTYLLGVIDHALAKVAAPDGEGLGAVAGRATTLAGNIYGYEIMVGPYAVAELRVPLTGDGELFEQVAELGRKLLWLHTYAQRYTGKGRPRGKVPAGKARCVRPVPQKPDDYPDRFDYDAASRRLTVGAGAFEPVPPEVFEFEVSGLKVVKSWLGYRMRSGKGKKSSPLDDIRPHRWTAQFTTELLELLWVLEHTLVTYPAQAKLLDAVLAGPTLARRDSR